MPTLPSASLWRRLAALLYDTLLLIALYMVICFVALALNHGEDITPQQYPFLQTAELVASFIFYSWFWLHGGQTLGMRAWQIKLINQTNEPIRLLQCLLRFFTALISAGCLGLGYYWMLWDKDKQTWQDKYSMTKIVLLKNK